MDSLPEEIWAIIMGVSSNKDLRSLICTCWQTSNLIVNNYVNQNYWQLPIGEGEKNILVPETASHCLKFPCMYIGNPIREKIITIDEKFDIRYSPGEINIFLELLTNAVDNFLASNERGIDPRHIEITLENNWIAIKNYGLHIPIEKYIPDNLWIPEIIYGVWKVSSRYTNTKGTMGAKTTNIFSQTFIVECADPIKKLLYIQIWKNNMMIRYCPIIVKYTGIGYTKIIYFPHPSIFDNRGLDTDTVKVYSNYASCKCQTHQIPLLLNNKLVL